MPLPLNKVAEKLARIAAFKMAQVLGQAVIKRISDHR